MIEYAAVFEKVETGWSVYCPDVPGLASFGETFEDAQRMITEALQFHLEGLAEDGLRLPVPITRVGMVRAPSMKLFELQKSA